MADEPDAMSCQQFQAQLPELISSGADVEHHSHVQICDLCGTLLRNLEIVTEAARQIFPPDVPQSDFRDEDGDLEQGIPAILPKIPNQGRGSAAARLDLDM